MSYDPELDELKFSQREMDAAIDRVTEIAIRKAWDAMLDFAGWLPLQVYGRWEQGRVYDPSSLVFRDGRQWISTVQTASEPGEQNAAWRRVNFPNIRDTEPTI